MSLLKTNEIQNYNGSSLTLTASTVSTSAQLNTGGNISVTGSLNVSDDSTTRTNLGLGTIATQDADSIAVTGGTATLGALTVSGSDSGDLVRITQTGSGNALVVEDSSNPDSTPFVVDSSGNVGVGTSSPVSSSLITLKKTNNGGDGGEIRLINFSTTLESSTQIVFTNTTTDSANSAVIKVARTNVGQDFRFSSDGTERMRIDGSGALILTGSTAQKATGTTWSNPSDQRLKSNILDYPKGTAELMQVRVREWEYNGKGGTVAGTKGLGVVADEIMTVLPNTVDNYEAKLNVDDEETTQIKKFDATEITWLLVKTTQEQQTLIESQQSQIDALTTKTQEQDLTIASLISRIEALEP